MAISPKDKSNQLKDLSDGTKTALQDLKQLMQEALRDLKRFRQEALNNHEFRTPLYPPSSRSNGLKDLSDRENQALQDLKQLLQKALNINNEFTTSWRSEDVSIWGIPLLRDERSDVILGKFLQSRKFNANDALTMIKNTLHWRKEFGIEELVHENFGDDFDEVLFMHGLDKEGHPVLYFAHGEFFKDKELYLKTFSDEQNRLKFVRWWIRFVEKTVRKLDFSPNTGNCTIIQVVDLKNAPGLGKREYRLAWEYAVQLLEENYPEFIAKQVFINVPRWYLAFYAMISPFLTQRTKSKFAFAGPSKSAETLFKYVSPEQVPIQYGGLSVALCDCNPVFSLDDPVTETAVKPSTKQTVEIFVSEKFIIIWEIRVVGWEVSYGAEFVPNAEDGYTVIIHKSTKMAPADEPVVCNWFKIDEPGKVVLTIDNPTSKKKKLLYRFKVRPFSNFDP